MTQTRTSSAHSGAERVTSSDPFAAAERALRLAGIGYAIVDGVGEPDDGAGDHSLTPRLSPAA